MCVVKLQAGKEYKTTGGYDIVVDFVDEKTDTATGRWFNKEANYWTALDWTVGGRYNRFDPDQGSCMDIIEEKPVFVKQYIDVYSSADGRLLVQSTSNVSYDHVKRFEVVINKETGKVDLKPISYE